MASLEQLAVDPYNQCHHQKRWLTLQKLPLPITYRPHNDLREYTINITLRFLINSNCLAVSGGGFHFSVATWSSGNFCIFLSTAEFGK